MFPTRDKEKISKTLAYPLKAKQISEALADVPQASELSLSFCYWMSTAASRKYSQVCVVLSAEYHYLKTSQFTPHYSEERGSNDPQWIIRIQPVPAQIKHGVAQLLQIEALPKIHDWLCARADVTGKEGSCDYNVFYNEQTEQLEYSQRNTTL